MLRLQRDYNDGPDHPELVLLHYEATPAGSPGEILVRSSLVMPRIGDGRREVSLFLPDPPGDDRVKVRYFFSLVNRGREWFSPSYEVVVPGDEQGADLARMEEAKEGNLQPAAGWGMFRLPLPLREEEPRSGTAHFGFGAMRKKPSPGLCRVSVPIGGGRTPVIEIPEALSVLKGRPMPYFLYHYVDGGPGLVADKIGSVRITFPDEAGDVVSARLLWSDPSWAAPNLSVMEAKNTSPQAARDLEYFFAEDRESYLSDRARALAGRPVPRVFETFVFGPSGRRVEYCFQILRRRPDGPVSAEWRNRPGGGNWIVTI